MYSFTSPSIEVNQAGEMAQWEEHLFYKHTDMSSDPEHPHKCHVGKPSTGVEDRQIPGTC